LQALSFAAIPSEPNARRALSMVDQVLVLDPGYVDAWAARAGIRSVLVGMAVFPAHELEQAERDAQHADTLRRNAGTSALAFIHTLLGQWAEADREYQTALATDGRNDPITHWNYSLHLGAVGRKRRALELAQQAYELAPADQASIAFAALANLNLEHDAEALKLADLLTEFRPDNDISKLIRSTVAYRAGRFQEASDSAVGIALLTGRGLGGAGLEAEKLVYLAAADPAKVGRAREALDGVMHELRAADQPGLLEPYCLLGAFDRAYEVANRALDEYERTGWSGGWCCWVVWSPEMRSFRRDARFQQLVTRLKLIDYWKEYGPPDECDLRGDALVCR